MTPIGRRRNEPENEHGGILVDKGADVIVNVLTRYGVTPEKGQKMLDDASFVLGKIANLLRGKT